MKWICIIIFLLGFKLCIAQKGIPASYKKVMEVTGDLDKDGIAEVALIYNTGIYDTSKGYKRILYICRKKDNGLEIIKSCTNILRYSQDCGFCYGEGDDPVITLFEIKNNTLILEQTFYNNSRRTEKIKQVFRFQNDNWYLIGSVYRYFDTCDFDNTYEINFSTGKANITRESHDCEENDSQKETHSFETFKYQFKKKVTMDNYKPTELLIPNSKKYFYY